MNLPHKQEVGAKAASHFEAFAAKLCEVPDLSAAGIVPDQTAFLMVDLVNGFAKEGMMASEQVGKLCIPVADCARGLAERGIALVAFADSHTMDSPEFASYPVHCLEGDWESELVEELRGLPVTVIEKGSTNGAVEPAFAKWLSVHSQVDTFLLAGDCTDICVMQLALTLKTMFTRENRRCRVVLSLNLTDTFDAPSHDADLFNLMALNLMEAAGVELVNRIVL